MNAAWIGYFVGAAIGYGLVSRIFIYAVCRKTKTTVRVLSVHAVVGSLMAASLMQSDSEGALMWVPAIALWLVFDLWRVRLKSPQT